MMSHHAWQIKKHFVRVCRLPENEIPQMIERNKTSPGNMRTNLQEISDSTDCSQLLVHS
jgi:hypothetical protein